MTVALGASRRSNKGSGMGGIVFLVPLHPDDAARLTDLSDRCGLDPDSVIALAVHQYIDRQRDGIEPPPARGARLLFNHLHLKEQTK